jgi:polyisoprenoid-binding protein YceI
MRRVQAFALAFGASITALGSVSLASATMRLADATTPRAIDPARSKATFGIQHIFVERVTGTVPVLSGTVVLSAGSSIPVEVSAVLDAAHVDSGDKDRDGALTGPDYFDTAKFPAWTFASTKIAPAGPAAFGMDGLLTIHGVAQPEHLEVTVGGDAARPTYHATGHIDRHAFGMKGARLDPVIGKIADITLDIALRP